MVRENTGCIDSHGYADGHIAVADFDEVIKMPINEPAHGKKVS